MKIGKLYKVKFNAWAHRGDPASGFRLQKDTILLLFEQTKYTNFSNLSFLDGEGRKAVINSWAAKGCLEEFTEEEEEKKGSQKP